jgi:glycosyltransferase involved in cell wall biosynthesis
MNNKYANVWVVIPAYNEATVIGSLLTNVLETFQNVVVVDDCSTDATDLIAWDAGASVIRHPVNLGQGAALQTGIQYCVGEQDAEVIVTFDADGQHRVEDALAMVEMIRRNEADIVCGSRFLGVRAEKLPIVRRFVLKVAALFTRLTTGVKVTDAHNGLRAMSRDAAAKIKLEQNRMAHASEVVHQIGRSKLRYAECPIQVRYTEYSLKKGQKLTNMFSISLICILEGS